MKDGCLVCVMCGTNDAVGLCDGCGRPVCRKCRMIEIWGTGAESLTFKHFCAACKRDPEINPWGAGEALNMVNDVFDAA